MIDTLVLTVLLALVVLGSRPWRRGGGVRAAAARPPGGLQEGREPAQPTPPGDQGRRPAA